eukprot:g15663.t1
MFSLSLTDTQIERGSCSNIYNPVKIKYIVRKFRNPSQGREILVTGGNWFLLCSPKVHSKLHLQEPRFVDRMLVHRAFADVGLLTTVVLVLSGALAVSGLIVLLADVGSTDGIWVPAVAPAVIHSWFGLMALVLFVGIPAAFFFDPALPSSFKPPAANTEGLPSTRRRAWRALGKTCGLLLLVALLLAALVAVENACTNKLTAGSLPGEGLALEKALKQEEQDFLAWTHQFRASTARQSSDSSHNTAKQAVTSALLLLAAWLPILGCPAMVYYTGGGLWSNAVKPLKRLFCPKPRPAAPCLPALNTELLGAFFLCAWAGLLMVSLLMACLDGILHSTCGWRCGFLLSQPAWPNPFDELLLVLPWGWVSALLLGLAWITLWTSLNEGMLARGVHCLCWRLQLRPPDHAPSPRSAYTAAATPDHAPSQRTLLVGAGVFLLASTSLFQALLTLSPVYTSFAHQIYRAGVPCTLADSTWETDQLPPPPFPPVNSDLDLPAGKHGRPSSTGPQLTPQFADEHGCVTSEGYEWCEETRSCIDALRISVLLPCGKADPNQPTSFGRARLPLFRPSHQAHLGLPAPPRLPLPDLPILFDRSPDLPFVAKPLTQPVQWTPGEDARQRLAHNAPRAWPPSPNTQAPHSELAKWGHVSLKMHTYGISTHTAASQEGVPSQAPADTAPDAPFFSGAWPSIFRMLSKPPRQEPASGHSAGTAASDHARSDETTAPLATATGSPFGKPATENGDSPVTASASKPAARRRLETTDLFASITTTTSHADSLQTGTATSVGVAQSTVTGRLQRRRSLQFKQHRKSGLQHSASSLSARSEQQATQPQLTCVLTRVAQLRYRLHIQHPLLGSFLHFCNLGMAMLAMLPFVSGTLERCSRFVAEEKDHDKAQLAETFHLQQNSDSEEELSEEFDSFLPRA